MIKVMIVEDDPMVTDINSKFLKKVQGFTLYKSVCNLTEAKKIIQLDKPDLILLDVFLPNENGIDFLKWIRKNNLNIDVIIITADKTISRVQEAFRYGAIDYLIKPFSFERFKESLNQFKERYLKLKDLQTIEQEELDKLISNNKQTEEVFGLVKGLNKYTYNSIVACVEKFNNRYFTSEEVAENLKIAKGTVRKYLEYMTEEGEVRKVIEYGKIGRPHYKYKKTH